MLLWNLNPLSSLLTRCDLEDITCDLVRLWCDFCGAQVCERHSVKIVSPVPSLENESFQIFIGLTACLKCAVKKPFNEKDERELLRKLVG